MVKTLEMPHGLDDARKLDAARISGMSMAIATHVIVFGLLLMPARVPIVEEAAERTPVVFRDAVKPPPPLPVPVEKTQPKVVPVTQTRPVTPPRTDPTVLDDQAKVDVPADHANVVASNTIRGDEHVVQSDVTPIRTGPLEGISLQYLSNPSPAYPRDALREGVTGTVLLKVLVDVDGKPLSVEIENSSGDRRLDRAAREQVLRRWKFVPAKENGVTVQAIGLVPVAFSIN